MYDYMYPTLISRKQKAVQFVLSLGRQEDLIAWPLYAVATYLAFSNVLDVRIAYPCLAALKPG